MAYRLAFNMDVNNVTMKVITQVTTMDFQIGIQLVESQKINVPVDSKNSLFTNNKYKIDE